jgi:hypothetical protein
MSKRLLQLLAGTNVRLTVICLDWRCPNIYYLTPGSIIELCFWTNSKTVSAQQYEEMRLMYVKGPGKLIRSNELRAPYW